MTIPERIDVAIKTIESNFEGGLSNTSTKKFDELIIVLSEMTSIPIDDIYPTSVVKRASNVWNRLSQGKPLNKHFPLAVVIGAHGDEGGIMAPLGSFIGPGFVHYDNIAIIVPDTNGTWSLCEIVTNATDSCSLSLLKEYPSARVHIVNKAVHAQEDVVRAALFSDLENKFLAWLPSNGVVSSAEKYVRNLKAISEPQEPHTATGRWPGFIKDLTGDEPTPVFSVKSEQQFDDAFAKVIPFFMAEYADKGAISDQYPNPEFGKMFDFMHAAPSMTAVAEKDGQFTRGGFRKFRMFLHELEKEVHAPSGVKIDREDILAAIRTKPFVLLAGISGTGKSRLVRQLARGFCPAEHDLAKDTQGNQTNKPGNYELIPVKPNWHDSTELMGYVSRVSGKPEYVIKPFVRFLAKAWLYEAEGVPFFLCLDEMNLAPVEQYFAEYLSVIETRKMVEGGKIETDPLIIFENDEMLEVTLGVIYKDVDHGVAQPLIDMFKAKGGIPIPSNFVVMGTVNMDETTFSFSRKVLDRAMSFELNEVDMDKGLEADDSIPYGSLPLDCAKATYVEGRDVYAAEKATCDKVKTYLVSLNAELEGTPFKFAYRSRNEIMIYVVERIRNGVASLPEAVDEATSMKILSRVEGDTERITEAKLKSLQDVIVKSLLAVGGKAATDADVKVFLASDQAKKSPCFLKLEQMIKAVRDGVGFVSFWQN